MPSNSAIPINLRYTSDLSTKDLHAMKNLNATAIIRIQDELEVSLDRKQIFLPRIHPRDLGDRHFTDAHQLSLPYMAGSMAHGISSVALVKALASQGMLASFGAAGLGLGLVEKAIDELQSALGAKTFAVNFIHSPQELAVEDKICDLLLHKRVNLVEASAFMSLTKALVRYRVKNLHRDGSGGIVSPQKIIAKVSRVELARLFWSPAPRPILDTLLAEGAITAQEFELAQLVPMAQDLTAEADSGGHTDNRPLVTLLPLMLQIKAQLEREYHYQDRLRLGAAGGISTPQSALAAFSMGAAYVVTGSINQACVESGTSDEVRAMLAETEQSDFMMAPAADMFELGVKLQVLKKGTMFPMRAQKLYEIYRSHPNLEGISLKERQQLEASFFRCSIEEAWDSTRAFFQARDPSQLERAETNPKFKMALLFRSYLGQASHWAIRGDSSRRLDYQIWCGPAMAAFNAWVKGSPLEAAKARRAALVGANIMYSAALLQRIRQLNFMGLRDPAWEGLTDPRSGEELIKAQESFS